MVNNFLTLAHKYCAGLLVGLTNYNIQIGDILAWNHQREVFWYPEIEEMDEPWKMLPRKLFFGQGPELSDPFGMNEKEERILEDC
jgi:hypothetical protein